MIQWKSVVLVNIDILLLCSLIVICADQYVELLSCMVLN